MPLMEKMHSHWVRDNKEITIMNIQLIQGQFTQKDAINIITQLIQVKIQFQEDKIFEQSSEEDIKMRERRIKQLQKDLFDMRQTIELNGHSVNIQAVLTIQPS